MKFDGKWLSRVSAVFFVALLSSCATPAVREDSTKIVEAPIVPTTALSSNIETEVTKSAQFEKVSKTNRKPASNAWGTYHWARQTSPATLKLGNCLTNAVWRNHFLQASSDWNSPTTFGATSTPLLTLPITCTPTKRCSMVVGTTQVCNGSYGRNGWLGLASINISGDHITQGSAKMNDTYFSLATYNNANEKQHVMCQEIAHTFGLDHQSVDGSSQNTCMDYFSNTGSNATSTQSTRPNQHDFDELSIIYGHLDSTTTLAGATTLATAASDNTDNPNDWGALRSQSENGRGSYYERSNQDGSITVTHVYWTEDAAAKCPSCDHRPGY